MKKKVSSLLLVIIMVVLSTVGCSNAQSTSVNTPPTETLLEFESNGTYHMSGFGDEFCIYQFANPNSFVVYAFDSIYLLGEDAGETGISYASMFVKDSQFIALSDKYLLFTVGDEKIAVSLEERENVQIGESIHQKYLFEDLSPEEQDNFIYPIDCEKFDNHANEI